MKNTIEKKYSPTTSEKAVYLRWLREKSFMAVPDGRAEDRRFVVMMPLPNITGALHMGHAMDNIMQDLLVRWHRMSGDNTLWMPGTDHAGIATQAIVEKRLLELEGQTRQDIGQDALLRRIWDWKDEYQQRIVAQQQEMGCSCDWDRQRFTMDSVCTRAVREAFFRLFKEGLIYRGNRLVNWDCQLQTAVSDDEIVYQTVPGRFWHIRYPILGRCPGEPDSVVVATTRPETMFGDTAIAVPPDPAGELRKLITELEDKVITATPRDQPEVKRQLDDVRMREKELLPRLLTMKAMAENGRQVLLPLTNRAIPLILDSSARPELGSGCVKITPGHDSHDYEVWKRQRKIIGIINILNPDGTLNDNAGPYAQLDRREARNRVIEDLQKGGYIESVEDREIDLGHSDRSKTPIEPYLSRQWFMRMDDIAGGITLGAGTQKESKARGLAQAAIDVTEPDYRSPSGRRLTFHPDAERYKGIYVSWLTEKRDWCISRQLWWGHRIPIWHGEIELPAFKQLFAQTAPSKRDGLVIWVSDEDGNLRGLDQVDEREGARHDLLVCLRNRDAEKEWAAYLEKLGLAQDMDVLDTWFSSALWPFSTLGWPDPETADVDDKRPGLGDSNGFGTYLDFYYPGTCLVTGRDIISLWVARMQMMGLYFLGDLPFTECFIHANIQDGKGERMSKSKGNGIDPVDIIRTYGADAMRYVLCEMQTGSQDIRLPVQAVSPYSGKLIDLASASHGRTVFTYLDPDSGQEFDVLGTLKNLPVGKVTCERFEVGRTFCTKLWNAARFVLTSLEGEPRDGFQCLSFWDLESEDRWILVRLRHAIEAVTAGLSNYTPSQALLVAREFFWTEFCDWYLELSKRRLRKDLADARAGTVLAFCLDQILRLLHPFLPFITETLWEELREVRPRRGIDQELHCPPLLISASWPQPMQVWEDQQCENDIEVLQGIVRSIRQWRSTSGISPSLRIKAIAIASGSHAETVNRVAGGIVNLGGLENLEIRADYESLPSASNILFRQFQIYMLDVIDIGAELKRLSDILAKSRKELGKLEVRLRNPEFLANAPAETVANERRKYELAVHENDIIENQFKDLQKRTNAL